MQEESIKKAKKRADEVIKWFKVAKKELTPIDLSVIDRYEAVYRSYYECEADIEERGLVIIDKYEAEKQNPHVKIKSDILKELREIEKHLKVSRNQLAKVEVAEVAETRVSSLLKSAANEINKKKKV